MIHQATPTPAPCPWCGSDAQLVCTTYHLSYVRCQHPDCTASGPSRPTPADAVSHWDRIAGATAVERLNELRVQLACLREWLAIFVHAHQTGNSVPPNIDEQARQLLAVPQ